MYLADTHTHSICSPDGTVPMTQMAEGARRAGMEGLCITDHCDFLSLDGKARTTTYDWAPVLAQYHEMQRDWGSALDLTLGLEFGMGHLDPESAKQILNEPELDFVIGSIHNLTEEAGGSDFYFLPYESQGDCYRALDNYFTSMASLAQSPFYDVLGHIIYPLRYMISSTVKEVSLTGYMEQIRAIFRQVAQSGRGIEVNTWKGKTLKEWIPILTLFRESGGEIVTVGSDAHHPDPVGAGVREAYAMLRDFGFPYVAYYRERKPEFIKL